MKQILVVNNNGRWGGAERVLVQTVSAISNNPDIKIRALLGEEGELAERLRRIIGTECVHVFSSRQLKADDRNTVPSFWGRICALGHNIYSLFDAGLEVRRFAKRFAPDVIILNNQQAILTSPFLRILRKRPCVIGHEHTIQPSIVRRFIWDAILLTSIDILITVSKATESQHFSFFRPYVRQIYNGFEIEPNKMLTPGRPDYIDETQFSFVLPAVFRAWKGHSLLIDAAGILKSRDYSFRVYFIGDEVLESEAGIGAGLKSKVKKQGLEEIVRFCGFMKDPLPYIKYFTDVVIQPSTTPDPLPTTVIEAMALAKPVIGSNLGGMPEMIEHEKTGYIFPAGNAIALADAMENCLRSRELMVTFGNSGRMRFERLFSSQAYARSIEELIAAACCLGRNNK